MDPLRRLLPERPCERLALDFAHRLALGEPASVTRLFTEDGSRKRPPSGDGRAVRGREALRSHVAGRPAGRLSRRLTPDVPATVAREDTATAVSYVSAHRVDGYTRLRAPRPATPVNRPP
ncbi:nuclear transport factor 2 family protein [Streptomyces sp. NPDC004561]